ncbi:MAG: hypothetical protein ACXVB0_24565 [Mucilaginibacter sp.]
MPPKPFKQSLKYNPLFLPKEHRQTIQNSNYDLWNEITTINTNFPAEEILVDHVIKDYGNTYAVDLKLTCNNTKVQQLLDSAYESQMRLPRFAKHADFEAMLVY